MSRLSQIDAALNAVEAARAKCPFHGSYTGRLFHGADDACGVCRKRRNGDGGRCVIDHAEHSAVLAIEEAIA